MVFVQFYRFLGVKFDFSLTTEIPSNKLRLRLIITDQIWLSMIGKNFGWISMIKMVFISRGYAKDISAFLSDTLTWW